VPERKEEVRLEEGDFLDRLYEAAAIPELWPDVLDGMNSLFGVAASVLFGIQGADVRWATSPNFVETAQEYLRRGYMGRDNRTARLLQAQHTGFVRDLDVFDIEEWEADPIRRELFVPRGYGWGVATSVQMCTGDLLIVHSERRLEDGPPSDEAVRYMDQLRPHIARSVLMSRRLAFQQVSAATQALQIVRLAAAVLDGRGQLIAANTLFEAQDSSVVQVRTERLVLAQRAADERFVNVLNAFRNGKNTASIQSIPLPATETFGGAVLHCYPVRRQARDLFSGAAVILLLTPLKTRDVPHVDVVQALFDLTPAEARVAQSIGQGASLEEHAVQHGVSHATVRTQLKAIFQKTGLHRQSDLAGLLQAIAPPG
jgi:DNA-binding CsgD family transcriptional regulator